MPPRPLQRVRLAGVRMWTLLSVPRKEGSLSARVRNDVVAMGGCERYSRGGLIRHLPCNVQRSAGSNSHRRMVDT